MTCVKLVVAATLATETQQLLPLATETLIWFNIIGCVGGILLRCNYHQEYLACEQEGFPERYIYIRGLRTIIWRALSYLVENCLVTA